MSAVTDNNETHSAEQMIRSYNRIAEMKSKYFELRNENDS